MTVCGKYARIVEVVEQAELLGKRMVVRSDERPKLHQRRIAVTGRHVAQYLIVGAVLFDYVDYVLDGVALAENG